MATRANPRRRVSYPVENLRAQVAALEAAIAQVLARPKKEAVHGLRKCTRKIEAQLAVMAALAAQEPGFKAVAERAKRVSRQLAQVRRAAGKVRDLDVQRKLAKDTLDAGVTRGVRRDGKEVRRQLKAEREQEAQRLVKVLESHALKLEPRLERLLEELQPMAEVGMSAIDLEVLTRAYYDRRRARFDRKTSGVKQMHGIRKAAKMARYMAEDGLAARVVHEFEEIQESGGRWHDALTLRNLVRKRLGRRSGLAKLLEDRETGARSEFRETFAS